MADDTKGSDNEFIRLLDEAAEKRKPVTDESDLSDLFEDESPEDIERARLDAEEDEADEHDNGDDTGYKDVFGLKGYVASYAMKNRDETIPSEHGVLKATARSLQEALGGFYLDLTDAYPVEEGWGAPSIIVDPEFFLVVEGVPLLINPTSATDDACEVCGDPAGPCDDPETCPNSVDE